MKRDHITMLYDYNYWANARVLRAATRVTRAEPRGRAYRARPAAWPS